MPAADAAWLHMDRPLNPMVVNSVIWFDEQLDWERLREVVQRRIVDEFPRFRRCVHETVRGPRFEDDPEFDIEQHMHRRALPAPGDQAALQELVGDLITPPLDPTRPLWHTYLIEGYGDGCAVLFRIHHAIADGIALARVMLSLTDDAPDAGIEPPVEHDGRRSGGLSLSALTRPAQAAFSVARDATGLVVHEGLETLAHPAHVTELAEAAGKDAATLAKLLAAPADAETELRAPLHGTRRVAWSTPFPLERIRTAAHESHGTINDLLIAAVTGAIRAQLERSGPVPDDLHIMVPFNLRPLDRPLPRDLGNEFALILLALPVGTADRGERLREVKMRMDAIKGSHEGLFSYGILSAIGRTPPQVESRMIDFFTRKASAVVTNVPGPREQVYLAGTPVGGVLVWAPCSGTIGMTVSIFSYTGEVTVGFMADSGVVKDPDSFVKAFEAELEGLCQGVPASV